MDNLDKYYTKDKVAEHCVDVVKRFYDISKYDIVEPSAGGGAFLPYLPNYTAYDILPENENIIKQDFLKLKLEYSDKRMFIGNPPFGRRSKLSIEFFNHAATMGSIIAFIIPITWLKYSVQNALNKDFKLVYSENLSTDSFTFEGKDYDGLRCVFQIWDKNSKTDLRCPKPITSLPEHFDLWQYNATEQAYHYIDEPWKYAVYRQGMKDYSKLFTRKDYYFIKSEMDKNIQFFFMNPKNDKAEKFILSCDFERMANSQLTIKGISKGLFIEEYLNWEVL